MDRAFCASEVEEHTCGRELTMELREKAKKWWGSDDFPVAWGSFCDRQSVFFGGSTNSTNIKVNAVSGGIIKNHANSYFLRFNLKSELSRTLLHPEPYREREPTWKEKEAYKKERYTELKVIKLPVEVLQLVVVGDMEVIAEVIDMKPDTPPLNQTKDERGA